nr:TPA_asm: m42 uORF RNA *1 [Murid betaherpesvirus 1]DBA07975.1 TPA_asm: m42 uORF RNA *1 [Murid betaherpesvirus 1]
MVVGRNGWLVADPIAFRDRRSMPRRVRQGHNPWYDLLKIVALIVGLALILYMLIEDVVMLLL